MKRFTFFTAFFIVLLSLKGPGLLARADDPASKVSPIAALQPIRVVYRQVEGVYLKSPRGVFVDNKSGEIYVADTMNDLIAVYNKDGLPVFSFGYNKELKEPVKAITDLSGRIYVLNGIPRAIKIFNYRGEYLNDFPLSQSDQKSNPTAIMVDDKGNVYVAISGETGGQIQIYDSQFRLGREFGKKADGNSHFKSVQAITVDSDGTIYVADGTATPCIQVFTPEGKFLRGWGAHDAGPHNFSLPAGIAIDGEGRVIVVDSLRHAISVFTKEGTFLGRHGGLGSQPGAVTYPTDIASNGNGKIYVVERLGSRMQVLEEKLVTARQNPSGPLAPNGAREQMRRELGEVMRGMR